MYKIVKDEQILKEFIEWLPELKEDEVYYVCLFARGKYNPEVKSSIKLKRFTSDKSRLLSKLKQLECNIGAYNYKDKPIPNDALVAYIHPNPRSFKKATKRALVKFANLIADESKGYNPHQIVLSEIQKAKSSTRYIDFDFDDIGEDRIKEIIIEIEKICGKQTYLKTRGGMHVLVDVESVTGNKSFYTRITSLGCDVSGDNMIPIPGTLQGDFIPHFIGEKHE